MTIRTKTSQQAFAKLMAAACVRRGYLETLHSGVTPITKTGDYSDVRVIDAEGRIIPWNEVSRIDQAEMKTLMSGEDVAFAQALERAAAPWTREWDTPKYLDDFLMPLGDRGIE